MKIKCLVLALAFVLALGSAAFAAIGDANLVENPGSAPGASDNIGFSADTIWHYDGEAWVAGPGRDPEILNPAPARDGKYQAIVRTTGEVGHDCNMQYIDFEITHSAQILQWMRFSLDNTRMDWRVAKPGQYAAPLGKLSLNSNAAVTFTLGSSAQALQDLSDGSTGSIAAFYGISDAANVVPTFYTAGAVQAMSGLTYNPAGTQIEKYVWARIDVPETVAPGTYQDVALVTVTLENTLPAWASDGTTWY